LKQTIRRILLDRSLPGRRREEALGRFGFETLHVDGVASVEIDLSALDAMVARALSSRGKKCTDGPVTVRFAGHVRSTWSPDRQAWGLPQDPAPVTAGGAE